MSMNLVWFRLDLRLADNPALAAAAECGPFTPFYRACLNKYVGAHCVRPLPQMNARGGARSAPLRSSSLDDLGLEPTIDWAGGLREARRARSGWSPTSPNVSVSTTHNVTGPILKGHPGFRLTFTWAKLRHGGCGKRLRMSRFGVS